jgi:PAS domain S-box-containing protein
LALQESEHRFRTLIQEIDIGILLLTTATEIIESNEAAVELLGLHKSELTGRTAFSPDWQIIREDGSPFPAEDLPVVRAAKEKKCFENVVMGVWRPKSADYVWLMVNAKPQSHTDGSLKYVICSFNDITRLKEAEYKIWQHNRELGVLNKVISTAISDHSPERILSVACETLAQLLNFPIASSFLISPDKRSERLVAIYELNKSTDKKPRIGSKLKHNPLLADILHHKKPLTIKNPHQHPQMQGFIAQRPHIQSLIIFPLVVKDEVLATLVFESDTPRTLTAEEEELVFNVITQAAWVLQRGKLIEEQRLLSAVIEQSMESIIITDTTGYITYVNPTFEKISGYSQAEVQGHTPRIIKSDYHPPNFYRDIWRTITAGKVWEGRFHNQAKDGRHYIDEATIAPLRNEDGDITHFISIQREVTAQLEMEMQLRQAQKMESLGQLTGGIAHDFNNILTAIMGHASLAHETLPPQHLALEDLKYIQENAERASNLTRQLLTFARRNHTEPKNVNINHLILNLDKMLRRLIGEDIEMSIFLAEDLGHIKIDPGQFEQVLVNLVVNARDAMPEGGPVVIRTQTISLKKPKADLFTVVPPGTYTVLSVNDQGIGMTQETLERIFEPFFTTKEPGRGTGLGLATSFGIIKQHQGYILVDSYPQQGSTFTVYFPQLNEAAGTKGTSAPDATFLQGQEQILVVEDEAIIRQLACRVLTQQGYTVLEANNGQQALSLLTAAATLPDLLITDMVMPIMGGANLTEILRDRYPLLKILHMSGYIDRPEMQTVIRLPHFLQKPFTPAELLQKVRAALDENSAAQTNPHAPTPGPSRNKSSSE